jgi:hypothetical protein
MYLYKLANTICRMPLASPACLACAENARPTDDAPDSQTRQANVRFLKVDDQKRRSESIPTGTRHFGTLTACDFAKLMTKSFRQGQEKCDFANLMTKKATPTHSKRGTTHREGMPVRYFEFAHEKEKSPRSDPRTTGSPRAEHGKNKTQRRKMPSLSPHLPEITGTEVEPIR